MGFALTGYVFSNDHQLTFSAAKNDSIAAFIHVMSF
jgi:hypothetical protein